MKNLAISIVTYFLIKREIINNLLHQQLNQFHYANIFIISYFAGLECEYTPLLAFALNSPS